MVRPPLEASGLMLSSLGRGLLLENLYLDACFPRLLLGFPVSRQFSTSFFPGIILPPIYPRYSSPATSTTEWMRWLGFPGEEGWFIHGYVWSLERLLAGKRCSINIYWMNKAGVGGCNGFSFSLPIPLPSTCPSSQNDRGQSAWKAGERLQRPRKDTIWRGLLRWSI